jgi:8-oxo-dGTP pyrophosphatase MutT (NUDIX family)
MRLSNLLLGEGSDGKPDRGFHAAVAVVGHNGKWLLGLSKSDDDRRDKWCMPGGGIKNGENPEDAAIRECWEESGVRCKHLRRAIRDSKKPGVAFVRCKAADTRIKPNHEFAVMGWFTRREMKSLALYSNVTRIIDRVTQ